MMKNILMLLTCVLLLAACQPLAEERTPAKDVEKAITQTRPASESTSASASPSITPSVSPSTAVLPSASPSVSAVATLSASPSPSASPPPGSPEVSIFTDGFGGDVFTAKDTQMSAAWPAKNGGAHKNSQFETHQRILMEFDLSSIPADATLLDATLYLYHSYQPEGGKPVTVSIYSITAANATWTAGTKNIDPASKGESCWNALASDGAGGVRTAWAGSAGLSTKGIDYEPNRIGSFTFDPNSALGTEYAISLDPERVQGWFGASNTNYGIIFFTSANSGHVAQSSHSKTGYRPKLVVHYSLKQR